MAEARKMSKTGLFAHFVEHFAAVNISLKRADAAGVLRRVAAAVRATASGLRRVHAARHGTVILESLSGPVKKGSAHHSEAANRYGAISRSISPASRTRHRKLRCIPPRPVARSGS